MSDVVRMIAILNHYIFKMIILGIDPAIEKTGWGVVKRDGNSISFLDSSIIKTNTKDPLSIRLALISNKIEEVLTEFNPQIASMEEIFINKNPLSSLKLSHARGAIMSMLGRRNIKILEFAPNRIKKTLTGNGHATKEQMIKMVYALIPCVKDLRVDEADALAVAFTAHIHDKASFLGLK